MEDNIKFDLNEIGCEIVDLVLLAHGRVYSRVLLNAVMKHLFP
jgi:hypothetical protein